MRVASENTPRLGIARYKIKDHRLPIHLDCPFNYWAQQLFVWCNPFRPHVFLLTYWPHVFLLTYFFFLSTHFLVPFTCKAVWPPACCMHMHATDAHFFLFLFVFYLFFSCVLILIPFLSFFIVYLQCSDIYFFIHLFATLNYLFTFIDSIVLWFWSICS